MSAEVIKAKRYYSFDEYLQLEEQEQTRYEYYDGEVLAMAGGSLNHNSIALNISRKLLDALETKDCRVFQENVKLELPKHKSYVYPDILVSCDEEDVESAYLVKRPILVAEVLSPSTAKQDREEKLYLYKRIPTLRYYLLISQQRPYIEVYSRTQTLAIFQYQDYEKWEDVIQFPDLNLSITLRQIYQKIRFPESDERTPGIYHE